MPTALILAQSGLFEIIESVVAALVNPELRSAYLGTEGDEWDAQKDMASAFGGAALAMIVTLTASKGARKKAHHAVE